MYRVITQLVLGLSIFVMNVFLISVSAFLRLLPALLPLLGLALRGLLVISSWLFMLVLTRLAPVIHRQWKINLLQGLWRLATTIILALAFDSLIAVMLSLPLSSFAIVLFLLHGLVVDYFWDEIPGTGRIQMGVDTK